MSEENVEIVRRIADHFAASGEVGPTEAFDPEVTFMTRGDVGSPQTFRGYDGLRLAQADFGEVWARIEPQLIELIDDDDVVVAMVRIGVHSHAGLDLEIEEGWAYWFRDGRVVRIEQHASKEKALEAAGLSE
jgi:ketosteroid isomerase-like protein